MMAILPPADGLFLVTNVAMLLQPRERTPGALDHPGGPTPVRLRHRLR